MTTQLPTRNIGTFWRMLRLCWQLRPLGVLTYAVGGVLEIASFLLTIYASAQLGGLLATFRVGADASQLWLWLWVDVAAAASIGLAFWLMEWGKRLVYFKLIQWSTRQFLSLQCRLDIEDFFDTKTRNKLNKIQAGYIWQMPNSAELCLDLVYGVVRFVVITVVVASIAWWLILVIMAFLLPSLFVERRLAKIKWFVWDSEGDWRHTFWGLEYIIRGARGQMELRSSQARNYVLGKIDAMNQRFYSRQEGLLRRANVVFGPAKVLEGVGTAVGSVVLLQQFIVGKIILSRYFFLSGALLRLSFALSSVFSTLGRMQESIIFAQDYFDMIDRQPRFHDNPDAQTLELHDAPLIEFRNVSFTYPGKKKPVFTDLSFRINPGEHVAIVGENGAGKTTLVKLLLRFYVPTSGEILINGMPLQNIAVESWYDALATLFQEFNQYPLTVEENILIGRSSRPLDTEQLRMALKASNADELVKRYPHGLETVLDSSFEKGIEPSGGQWQRMALARAFYRDALVLILDEPTAAIDAKAEYDIFNAIFERYKARTAIIISHRFSTVRRADRIIVVEHGKILEQGSHTELMQAKGLYHELFSKQAEGYRD